MPRRDTFRFQTGSIKRRALVCGPGLGPGFRFQTGSIKSPLEIPDTQPHVFRFQTGSIKSWLPVI